MELHLILFSICDHCLKNEEGICITPGCLFIDQSIQAKFKDDEIILITSEEVDNNEDFEEINGLFN